MWDSTGKSVRKSGVGEEEIGEFEAEVENMDKEKAEAEFGDVMFSLINAARLYKINPDNALEHTNQKFIRRFNYLEEHTIKQGKELKNMTLEEMDAIWNEAKSKDYNSFFLFENHRWEVWIYTYVRVEAIHTYV